MARDGLAVIGAGFGRTGTTSLKRALELLGFGPCYHMQTAMTRLGHARFWLRARAGRADFRKGLRGYGSAIDWPACEFYRELLEANPDAKVILTVRDGEAWYRSVRETLWTIARAYPWWFPPSIGRMQDAVIWKGRFQGRFEDAPFAMRQFREHQAAVQRDVPADRLLVYDVAAGWAPLCAFLGVPVPAGVPFPRRNDRRVFRRIVVALRVAEWVLPIAALSALIGTVLWLRL
jgi:hypothetical protein